jgi:hypothetical protein
MKIYKYIISEVTIVCLMHLWNGGDGLFFGSGDNCKDNTRIRKRQRINELPAFHPVLPFFINEPLGWLTTND